MLIIDRSVNEEALGMVIQDAIKNLLMEDEHDLSSFSPQDQLVEMGLNSLMFAQLLVELESAVGVDPFADSNVSITDMHSVEDLTTAYSLALHAAATDR